MFDQLIESSKRKQRAGAGRYFFLTSLVYVAAFVAINAAVFWGGSAPVEAVTVTKLIAPHSSPDDLGKPAKRPREKSERRATTGERETTANEPEEEQPDRRAEPEPNKTTDNADPEVNDSESEGRDKSDRNKEDGGAGTGTGSTTSSGSEKADAKTKAKTKEDDSEDKSETKPSLITVSGGVLQGRAIRKVPPVYPQIAKSARAQGAVQVQITISEEGRVIEASILPGQNAHPLLRDAALQAARQWLFNPTLLSGVPVKAQGILTFNFTLGV